MCEVLIDGLLVGVEASPGLGDNGCIKGIALAVPAGFCLNGVKASVSDVFIRLPEELPDVYFGGGLK